MDNGLCELSIEASGCSMGTRWRVKVEAFLGTLYYTPVQTVIVGRNEQLLHVNVAALLLLLLLG